MLDAFAMDTAPPLAMKMTCAFPPLTRADNALLPKRMLVPFVIVAEPSLELVVGTGKLKCILSLPAMPEFPVI